MIPVPSSLRSGAGRALLVLVVAGSVLYRSPWSASGLDITPDSVEYALTGHRLARTGQFALAVQDHLFPSRYPPWFALGVLAPAYRLAPGDLGNAILPILGFALLGILAAYRIGRRLGGDWGGPGAALLLLITPHFHYYARQIMSDVPATALALLALERFLAGATGPTRGPEILASMAVGAAGALRPLQSLLALPFLARIARAPGATPAARLHRALVFTAPLLVIHAATALYNLATFAHPFRTGRHFWRPVPFDYPELLFSARYVPLNLDALLAPAGILALTLGLAGVLILRRSGTDPETGRSGDLRRFLGFAGVGILPQSVIHLTYFFVDLRFHLPLLTCLAILGGAGLGRALGRRQGPIPELTPGVAVLLLGLAALYRGGIHQDPLPASRIFLERILEATPRGSAVLTGAEPVYLEYMEAFLQGSRSRQFVALSRRVPYATTPVAPRRIPDPEPYPASAVDVRCPGLFARGAFDPIRFTADERWDLLAEWLRTGQPVFVDLSYVPGDDPALRELRMRFRTRPRPDLPWLLQVQKPITSSPGRVR